MLRSNIFAWEFVSSRETSSAWKGCVTPLCLVIDKAWNIVILSHFKVWVTVFSRKESKKYSAKNNATSMPEPILIPCFNCGQKGKNQSKNELMKWSSNPGSRILLERRLWLTKTTRLEYRWKRLCSYEKGSDFWKLMLILSSQIIWHRHRLWVSLTRPRPASPVDSLPQKSGQKLYGPRLQLRLWILFRPTSSCGIRCVSKFSLSSNFLHRAGWGSTRDGSLASGRPGLGLDSGCDSLYNNFQILNLFFLQLSYTCIHRFFFTNSKYL